jgi:uncharacterized protein YecE (DUF72 family)
MIYVGTCGFSYADWREVFYPPGLKRGDFLGHYTSEFQTLELNTTFYRLPDLNFLARIGEKTPEHFRLIIKAYRGLTHEIGPETPDQLDCFLLALKPLIEGNRFGGILVQFPYSFHRNRANLDHLRWILDRIGAFATIVEFRNRDWFQPDVWAFLRTQGAAFCSVDEPALPGLLPPVGIVTSRNIGYVRFHGRNAEKWWRHEDPSERYDYLYSDEELIEWRDQILDMAAKAGDIYVMFNNHRGGKAVINARTMACLLGDMRG